MNPQELTNEHVISDKIIVGTSPSLAFKMIDAIQNQSWNDFIKCVQQDVFTSEKLIDHASSFYPIETQDHSIDVEAAVRLLGWSQATAIALNMRITDDRSQFTEIEINDLYQRANQLLHQNIEALNNKRLRLITRLQNLRDEKKVLQATVHLDSLTGLLSRDYFFQRLKEESKRSKEAATPLALFFIDIDNFKVINDSSGHAKGDQVLKEVATFIQSETRCSDYIGRYGGDEFLILVNQPTREEVTNLADNLLNNVQQHVKSSRNLTISIGIAFFVPENIDSESKNDLFHTSDAALMQAKNDGKNCFTLFDQPAGLIRMKP